MKPIPTLKKPLSSLDIETGKAVEAAFERSDTCAVPAACIVGEAMMAWVLISAITEQFGGDTVAEIRQRWKDYIAGTKGFING
jgi:chorismate synthase